VREGGIL